VDASSPHGPREDLKVLVKEMNSYDASLLSRPAIVAANKVDLLRVAGSSDDDSDYERDRRQQNSELLTELAAAARELGIQCDDRVVATSAGTTGHGLRDLAAMLRAVVEAAREQDRQHDPQHESISPSDAEESQQTAG
jgi:GTPase involved in cell partitioning and DNA repair